MSDLQCQHCGFRHTDEEMHICDVPVLATLVDALKARVAELESTNQTLQRIIACNPRQKYYSRTTRTELDPK